MSKEEEIKKIKFLKEELKHIRDIVNKLNGKQIMEYLKVLETKVLEIVTSMYNSNKEFTDKANKLLKDSEDWEKLKNLIESSGLSNIIFGEQMIENLITKEKARQAIKDRELFGISCKALMEKVIDTIRIYKERLEEYKICSECGYEYEELADICEKCGNDLLGKIK